MPVTRIPAEARCPSILHGVPCMPSTVDNRQSLSGLAKLLRASPGRKTRLHTLRGQIVSPSAVAALPGILLGRLMRTEPDGPWFNTLATARIKDMVQPHWSVFEFGSGRSTAWYADHAASVTALECMAAWHAQVESALSTRANGQVELLSARAFVDRMSSEPDDIFDLIVVDGADFDEAGQELPPDLDRTGCVLASMTKVKPGGVIVLDNSDRPRYRRVEERLSAWPSERLSGFPNSPLTPTETTFFSRPLRQPARVTNTRVPTLDL
jgi:hypothetical protein